MWALGEVVVGWQELAEGFRLVISADMRGRQKHGASNLSRQDNLESVS